MQKAYNPQTGEVIFLVDNQWVKPNQTARNPKTGQMAYLVNNSWQIVDPMTSPEEVVTSPEESLTPVTPTEAQTRLEALTKQYEAEVPFTQRITDPLKRGAIQLGGVIPGIDVTNRQKEIDRIRSGDAGRTDPITGEFIPLAPEEAEAAISLLQQDQVKSQRQIMETQARAGEIRQRPAVEAIGKAKTMREALEAFGADPIGVAASVSLESVTQMAPALILAAVTRNPTLGAAALGGSSYALELSSGVYEHFQENGVNLSDQEAVKNALNDPKMFQAAVDFAQTRAGIVGTADLASAGLASRLLVPKKLITSPGGREIANIAVAQPLSQIASGAGGEAAAQLATYGEVKKPGEVLLEAVGGPSSVLETAVFGGKRIYDQLKPPATPEAPTTASVETRVEPTLGEIPPAPEVAPAEPVTPPPAPEEVEAVFADEDLGEEQKPTAKPEAPVKAEEPPPVQNLTGGLPIQEIPIQDLKISEEVPQFKIGATKEGVVEPLGGKFERTGVAPIQVWKRTDGSLEVISGRHRFDLAKRSKEQTIPAQIHDEAQGFTKDKAAILDAELNIRDGQGKVKDYVGYFKGSGISKDEADARGLLARPIGKRSYTIADSGSEELITAHRADAVGDEAAYLISLNAPGDASLQAVGIKAIQEGKSISSAVNLMQAVKTLAGERQTTTDMFGFDESAMKEAEEMAKIAARKQREIQQRLSVMTGASKNPELAEKEGINVKDPVAVRRRVDELRQAKAAFDNWSSNSELIGQIRAEMKPSEFALRPQTEEDLRAQEAAAAEREAAELKAIADREVGLFGLQPQVQEREALPSGDLFGAQGLGQQPGKKAPPAPPIETGLFAQKDQATINRERQAEQREKAAEKEKPTKGDVLLIEVNEKDFAKALDVSKIEDPRLEELFDTKQKPAKPQPEQFLSPKEANKIIDGWKKEANKQGQSGDNANKTVISLFDASGEWSKPWADAGFNVVTYDLQTGQDIKDFDAASLLEEHGNDNVWAILAAPPCTDFASSGAQYWKSKDADGRTELSNELVRQVLRTVELLRPAVWAMENPVGRMAKLNELPPAQLTFQPNLYGNPYTKKTLLWGNFNNQLPQAPVEPTDGSKIIKISGNNKYERSLTPEGFAYSFFAANNPVNMTQEDRLSREFHGITPAEFKDAGTEEEIRRSIEDDYFDGNLDEVKKTLNKLKSTPKDKPNFYKELLPKAGFTRLDINNPRTYKNKSGDPFLTFERDGVRVAFESNNLLYADKRGRVGRYMGNDLTSSKGADSVFAALLVDPKDRKQGKARKALQEIVKMADESNTNLYLEPASLDTEGMTTPQLKDFYKQFGFKPQETEPATDKVMIRKVGAKAEAKKKPPSTTLLANIAKPGIDQPQTKKLPKGRSPELVAAAQDLADGKITKDEYEQAVKKYKPIYPYEEPPKPATYDQVYDALDSNKRSKVNPEIKAGTPVGLRLDIPSFNRKGIFTVSIHEKRTPSAAGDVIGYGSVGRIKNVTFGLGKQTKALDIAKGASKDVIQTMEGTWVPSTEAEIVAEVNKNFNNPEWTQVGINPERHSYFWDRFTTVPVISADEVIQVGNFILAKNPVYGTKEDFLFNISSQPQLTQTDRFFSRITYRQEMIDELRALKVRKAKVIKDITNYGSDIATQRLLNELNEQIESIKLEITSRPVKSAENFINQARNAMDGKGVFRVPSLEPEVFAVIKQLYLKYPFLLEGLQLSIRTKKISPYPTPGGEVLGSFNGARRLVTLWNGTDGVSNPETVRHEVMHSLEQMMNGPQKQAILDSYFKALRKAIQKNTDPASQKFFENVIKFLNNPSESLRTKAIDTMPSLDFYQYVNPSEYWAVNAEKLMAANLGTAWAQFKKLVSKLFEVLKDFFGFDNRFAVHQVFDNILKNKPHRMSYMSLVDMEVLPPRDMLPMTDKQVQDFLDDRFKDEPKFAPTFLANVKKEQDLIDKHKRPKTPMLNTNEVKTFIVDGFRLGKEIFQDAVKNPGSAVDTLFNSFNRGLLYLRNQGVFFGAGLEEADRLKNEGMMRDTNDIISASVALDNALHGPMISAEVITRGGITYDNKLEVYRAENLKTNMINVYKAQAELKEKLGAQLGEDIIQGYLEAKRSRSILEEEKARNEEVGQLRQQLSVMSESDPDYDKILNLLGQAAGDLINIQNVVKKINMSDEAINEFIDLEKVHPELRTIIENYNGTNQSLLKFHRRVGLLSKERYLRLSQIKDYVPWQRIMDDEADIHSPVQSTTRKMVNIGKEKLFKKGKPKNVIDFVAEDGQTEFKIQPSSVVGISVNDVKLPPSSYTVNSSGEIKLSKPLNSGDVVLVQSVKEIENIIDNMTRNIMRMTMNGLRQAAAVRIVQQYASRDAKGKIIVFPRVDPKKGHLDFIANGRRIVVEIKDPLIATSMLGMESIGIKTVSVLAQAANFTRRAITVDPFFQIAQLVKDAPTAAFISGVKNPFALVSSVLTGFASSLNEKDPVVQLLRSAGIGGFQSAARTPEAKIKRQIGIINKSTYDAIIEVLDKIGDASDMAQRRAVYIRVLKETGDEARALYQASTIAPFHRHGASGIAQFFVKTVPFMNAYAVNMDIQINALQGKNLKGMKRNAALGYLIGTGIAFSSISLLYALAAGLDDDYWELDDQTKLRNIYVPFSKSLTGYPILIPMNTGPAFLFKALPEMLFLKVISEGTDNEIDRARLKRALGTAALDSLLGPSPVPSVIKPIVEINLNRNFFTGRELVPRGMENLEEYRKYSASTSELGKVLGSITDYLNPIEADHLIRSLFGTAGALSMWASNLALGASTRPEMTLKDVPGAGRFIGPQYPRGKEDLFYDLLERTKTKHNTFEDKIKTMDVDEAIKYAEKNAGLIALHNYMTQLESDLKEINRDINQMGRGSKELGLDPKERREMIDNLQNLKRSQLTGIERLRNLAEEIKLGE